MNKCVHRGTNEIGGTCIELSTCTTRILLDVGTPLTSMTEDKPLDTYRVPVRGLYCDGMMASPQFRNMLHAINGDSVGCAENSQ